MSRAKIRSSKRTCSGRLSAPHKVTWQRRPFPDANLLLLRGRQPALVDSGFTGHAEETAASVRAHTGHRHRACL